MKENLKPCVYKLWKCNENAHDRVLFVERSGELHVQARLSIKDTEPKGNQVLIGRIKSVCVDPKPGDLSMSRLKST